MSFQFGGPTDIKATNDTGAWSITSLLKLIASRLSSVAVAPTVAASGEIAGAVAAGQLPDVASVYVQLKARATNVGNVYVGAAGVTVPNGTTDATSGLELGPGESTGWLPIDNLNRLYRICDNAADALTYLAVR